MTESINYDELLAKLDRCGIADAAAAIRELRAKLLDLAGECAECGGTGSVQQGTDPTGAAAMYACDACFDIRALL